MMLFPIDSASVQILSGDSMQIVGGRGFKDPSVVVGTFLKLNEANPIHLVCQRRATVTLYDAQEEYINFHYPPHNHIHGWLGVPLIIQNELIGAISLDSINPGHFTPDHARLVTAFADQVAIALNNARLYRSAQEARAAAETAAQARSIFLANMSP